MLIQAEYCELEEQTVRFRRFIMFLLDAFVADKVRDLSQVLNRNLARFSCGNAAFANKGDCRIGIL